MSLQQHDRLRAAVRSWRRAKGSTITTGSDIAAEAVTRAQLDALRDEIRALQTKVNGVLFSVAAAIAVQVIKQLT